MEVQKRICRLCLKICEHFQAVESNLFEVLDKIQLKINLAVSEEPVLCTNCAKTLKNSFDFKAMCSHNYAVSLLHKEENAKLDLNKVYLSKTENVLGIPEDQAVCALCMGLVNKCSAISLEYYNGNVMLEKCLPELDFSIINTPIICGPCQERLHNCFHFIKDCLVVEEEVQKYCEAKGIISEGLVELTDVPTLIWKEEGNEADVINTEGTINVRSDIRVEHKDENFEELEGQKLINVNGRVMVVQLNNVEQFTSELDDKKCEIKTDPKNFTSLQDLESPPQNGVGIQSHRRCGSFNDVEAENKSGVHRNALGNKNSSEITMYYCESCSFKTRFKRSLHLLSCPFKGERKEVIHKCGDCSFQTKYRGSLQNHMKTHMLSSEATVYQCLCCPFKTKYKGNLRNHLLLTHKDQSEITMHQCDFCSYQTKYKHNLQAHMITHIASTRINNE